MSQFTEAVKVTGLQLINNGETQVVNVTLQRPDNSTFIITDAAANASEYPFGGTIPHTVGS